MRLNLRYSNVEVRAEQKPWRLVAVMMGRWMVSTGALVLVASCLAACGGVVGAEEHDGAPGSDTPAGYAWDPGDFAPKRVAPPTRAAAWDWPLGELELQTIGRAQRSFDVQSAAPSRRLMAEDFRDWVYAKTILESGIDLASANRETAEADIADACDDDDEDECWEREQLRRLAREEELAKACYESGLVACYLAGWLDVVDTSTGRYAGDDEPPPAAVRLEPGLLERGPVDLPRFFVGLMLDDDRAESTRRGEWGFDATWIAYAIADSGAREAVSDELRRRALDQRRDPWSRTRMLSVLMELRDLQSFGVDGASPVPLVRRARPACVFAVLEAHDWTVAEAHSRCIEDAVEAADRAAWRRADFRSAMSLLDRERH